MQAGANASALNTHENTPVDEALIREYQDLVDIVNEFNNKSGGGNGVMGDTDVADEIDDIPDDAEEAVAGEGEGEDDGEMIGNGGDR
jgi:hypothetical protein